jgi:hypothetical protein
MKNGKQGKASLLMKVSVANTFRKFDSYTAKVGAPSTSSARGKSHITATLEGCVKTSIEMIFFGFIPLSDISH